MRRLAYPRSIRDAIGVDDGGNAGGSQEERM